ncbi:AAA family ATPase [Paracoccus saliphilus]|uniref:AAA ATPase domain-containing protein n=1 Tax=Paracoccus saliphilus TaxID=405559 RepID=A0AA45W629_9RHOB|nr:AAA family ATPase [Paracoccus saliphilus]WCR01624.1 AAA family ATPase [Paracoccus saliphilus]SIS98622.1 AAA ATPase domain-containing protein [Paracoccus saliphilus]
MAKYLDALAVSHYRGIGASIQYVTHLSDINFFIGQNNSGKSIFLNLIHERIPFIPNGKGEKDELGSADLYRGGSEGSLSAAIGISTDECLSSVLSRLNDSGGSNHLLTDPLETIINNLSYKGYIWIEPVGGGLRGVKLWNDEVKKDAKTWLTFETWRQTFQLFTRSSGGSIEQHWVPNTIDRILSSLSISLPESMLIPAKRQLGPKGEDFEDLTGKGLIDHLAEIQNPDHHEREKNATFQRINKFVREVTGKSDAALEVPSNRRHLLVHMDGKVLPLTSLGTGIHEVVLIASFCTIYQNRIMCIEEPEIHLHPILQRKLIDYLEAETDNQYFITTHSAAFIDQPGAAIYHVKNDGEQTFVSNVVRPNDTRNLIDDLGYRASDILQSNAIVWVEGPSDRIYIRHWLSLVQPNLKEGIHYSIMFYGGSLIRHISADDEAVDEFIKLTKMNRNFAILIDSDKRSSRSRLKPAAQRLKTELSGKNALVWITNGREIENYINPDALHKVLRRLHSRTYESPISTEKFDHSYHFKQKGSSSDDVFTRVDKVRLAQSICCESNELEMFDLRKRVNELALLILRANGFSDTS